MLSLGRYAAVVTLRNGDAHLKNFGVVYDDVLGEARLAPVYDLQFYGFERPSQSPLRPRV